MARTLNTLMNGEYQAAHLYFQAGAWASQANLSGSSGFFLGHASEEMMHMEKLLTYMLEIDVPAKFEALPEPEIKSNDIVGLIKQIYEHEKMVTQRFLSAAKEASDTGDLSTFEFLQWYVAEQREEESLFRDVLEKIDLIGDGPHSLYFIDTEIAKISAKSAAAASSGGASGAASGAA
ncbi:MAG: ferritin [Pseudomonadota bacterium]